MCNNLCLARLRLRNRSLLVAVGCFLFFCLVLFLGVSLFCLCYDVVVRSKGKEKNKMWYFNITANGFQVFEILPDCVKPSGMFLTASLKSSLDGVLSYIRHAYVGMDVNVDIDNATFDIDGTMVGMVKVSLV